jgi:predicted kinase
VFHLLPFYRCYRAYVRGKVLSFRLDQHELTTIERKAVSTRARRYFDLAGRYASRLRHPTVIVVAGLSGTGKTSLARAIAGEFGLRVVSSDAVRKSLFEINHKYEFGVGPYSDDASVRTYRTLIQQGRHLLLRENSVVLDATFKRASDRDLARQMADAAGARWRIIECTLPSETARERLQRRETLKEGLSDANWCTYLLQRGEFEQLTEHDEPRLKLETNRDLAVLAHLATDWLRKEDVNVDRRCGV